MTIGPWHRWFAWHPVETEQHGWRWFRTVERQKITGPTPGNTHNIEETSND